VVRSSEFIASQVANVSHGPDFSAENPRFR
jgi:hypothetical protein